MKYVNAFWTRQEIPDWLEGSVKCYNSMTVHPKLLSIHLSCSKRRAYKTIEEKLIKLRTSEEKEVFKQAKEPKEEGKTEKKDLDKIHSSLLCAELNAVGLSYKRTCLMDSSIQESQVQPYQLCERQILTVQNGELCYKRIIFRQVVAKF